MSLLHRKPVPPAGLQPARDKVSLPAGGGLGSGVVTGTGSREAQNRRILKAVGDFLIAHHLYPGPANYSLAYQVIAEPQSPIAKAVGALTSDGLRLAQADADRLRAEFGVDMGAAADADNESLARARQQIDDFASIVETTRAETQAYGADLERGAAELVRVDVDHPAVADIARITGVMVARTRVTEVQLDAAREEARALRQRLAEAEEEARSDPLTGLPNRRAFEDRLADLLASEKAASIAICDIDHFKVINDSHGHAVGDRVLRMVADVLRSNCEAHMVARIGGEEFVVLFEGIEPPAAGALLDRARSDLAGRSFRVRGTDAPLGQVTFSAGVARCADGAGDAPLKHADDLLYKAKKAGRNQVLIAQA